MSHKVKALRLEDLKVHWQMPEKQFYHYDHVSIRVQIVEEATRTLTHWLDARLLELVREKVHRDDIVVRGNGHRTVIYVQGKPRFEFKLKCTMGGV